MKKIFLFAMLSIAGVIVFACLNNTLVYTKIRVSDIPHFIAAAKEYFFMKMSVQYNLAG